MSKLNLVNKEDIKNILTSNGFNFIDYNLGIYVILSNDIYVDIYRGEEKMVYLDALDHNVNEDGKDIYKKRNDSSVILEKRNLIPFGDLIETLHIAKKNIIGMI